MRYQAPILKVGASIRLRFLEKAKDNCIRGTAIQPIVEAGNAAAHRGDMNADGAVFVLGYLSNDEHGASTTTTQGSLADSTGYLDLYQSLYAYNQSPTEWQQSPPYTSKLLGIHNLTATMSSCSSFNVGHGAATSGNVSFDRFSTLARDCLK
jgi:hypothetical protein